VCDDIFDIGFAMAHDEPAMTSPMIAKLEDNRNLSTALATFELGTPEVF